MTSFFRWQVATLMLTVGLAFQSAASSEEFCSQCAQKNSLTPTQKFHDGKGYADFKGQSQKGSSQRGHTQRDRSSHSIEHKWFYSHHPPAAPIVDSVAVRRVPVPQQVNFRIQRESGQLRPESGAAPTPESGAAPMDTDNINQRLTVLEKHVSRLYESLDKLVTQLQQ